MPAIETIPQLDEFLAAKNKRLGIPHISLIAPAACSATPLTAPEYRPSADDILDVLADHYVQDKQTIAGWLRKMNFDAIPPSEGNQ